MSRRPGRTAHHAAYGDAVHGEAARGDAVRGDADWSAVDTEAEAVATQKAIAGLRYRLRSRDTIDHPVVRQELLKLEEQLAQLEQADRSPGRHRSPGSKTLARRDLDSTGLDLKPDPAACRTLADFIAALWQFKAWSGDPSWRKMAARAGQRVVHSTMHTAMRGTTMPKLHVVKAIVIGCGGTEDDLNAFTSAWCLINSAAATPQSEGSGLLAAPIATLQLAGH
ncbi:MAG TPA: hypothetical protein VMR14_05190 [Streptosporangiaceae bacterium]|jgi:hypothetical protein|nr:hypothetical protein [Streptosporangiaceae bacterium]